MAFPVPVPFGDTEQESNDAPSRGRPTPRASKGSSSDETFVILASFREQFKKQVKQSGHRQALATEPGECENNNP